MDEGGTTYGETLPTMHHFDLNVFLHIRHRKATLLSTQLVFFISYKSTQLISSFPVLTAYRSGPTLAGSSFAAFAEAACSKRSRQRIKPTWIKSAGWWVDLKWSDYTKPFGRGLGLHCNQSIRSIQTQYGMKPYMKLMRFVDSLQLVMKKHFEILDAPVCVWFSAPAKGLPAHS